MRTVSLEKQIAGIINEGQVVRSEEHQKYGEKVEIRTIQKGNFKCTVPMEYMAELLANARRMSRKKPEKYPVPHTQKILAFLSNHRQVIPYYVKMIKGKSSSWFKQQIRLNFPSNAEAILKEAIYGSKSDLDHVLMTMPPALKEYASKDISDNKKVVFRKFKDDGSIIALFPEMPWSEKNNMVTSYMLLGGHSGADYQGIISISEPAKKDECTRIMNTLEIMGYDNLSIVSKANHKKYLH